MSEAARPLEPGAKKPPTPRGRRPGEPSIFDDDPEEPDEPAPKPPRGRRPGEPSIFDDDVHFIGPTYPRFLPAGRRPGEPSIFDDDDDDVALTAPETVGSPVGRPEDAGPRGREPTGSARTSGWAESQQRQQKPKEDDAERPRIASAPEARRCRYIDAVSEGPPARCTLWTRKISVGVFDEYCQAHSPDAEASRRRRERSEVAAKASAVARASESSKTLQELFAKPFVSQDEVASARSALTSAMFDKDARRRATPAQVTAGLAALKAMGEHIERYGSTRGAEGGHSYMRLVTGCDIVEYEDPADAALTGPDLDRITAGIEQDKRNGLSPPPDIADCIKRYLGREARRREPTRQERQ